MPMPDDRFWALIQPTTAFESDPDRQIEALKSALRKLPLEDVESFEAAFDAQMKRSYSWDLWGAAYVIHGGASDDSFEYFRCWLLSRGRHVFEKILADPDSMADLLPRQVRGPLDFELFAYAARHVWAEKTGRGPNEMPMAANMIYIGADPAGEPFDEDPAHLSKRYPKLWQRFGKNPLY
jgi:hypothetical protein